MATVTGEDIPFDYQDVGIAPVLFHKWETLTTTNDVGSKFECPLHADIAVHVFGAEGTGGHLKMEGSNLESPTDADSDWFVIDDPQGNEIDVTSVPAGAQHGILARWVRPHCTAGDGSTDYDVILIARRR